MSDDPRDRELRWKTAVAAMAEFATAHGHTYPPPGTYTPDGRSLRAWAMNTRSRSTHGLLTPEQTADLNRVPHWTWRTRRPRRVFPDTPTGDPIEQIAAWSAHTGRLPHVSDGPYARVLHRHILKYRAASAAGTLDDVTAAALDRVPHWTWHWRYLTWADQVNRLTRHVNAHGFLPRHQAANRAERSLAAWHSTQRHAQLTDEQTAALDRACDGAPTAQWLGCYLTARAAADRAGTANRDVTVRAQRWLTRQQAAAAAGRLTPRQQALIVDFPTEGLSAAARVLRNRVTRVTAVLDSGQPLSRVDYRWLMGRRQVAATLQPWQAHILGPLLTADIPARAAQPVCRPQFTAENARRTVLAAEPTVAAARAALTNPNLPARLRPVLQARVAHPDLPLAALAARLGVSKDVYTGRLRRALHRYGL